MPRVAPQCDACGASKIDNCDFGKRCERARPISNVLLNSHVSPLSHACNFFWHLPHAGRPAERPRTPVHPAGRHDEIE